MPDLRGEVETRKEREFLSAISWWLSEEEWRRDKEQVQARGTMRHTISALVRNEFGVLSRISGLFSARGFNIESLTVEETLDPQFSRMTIVTEGNDQIFEQILKQVRKLVDVIKVSDLTGKAFVERELVLVKVRAEEKTRAEVLRTVDIFRGNVVDVTPKTYMIEVTGAEDKIHAMIDLLKPMGIREIVRAGRVAVARGD